MDSRKANGFLVRSHLSPCSDGNLVKSKQYISPLLCELVYVFAISPLLVVSRERLGIKPSGASSRNQFCISRDRVWLIFTGLTRRESSVSLPPTISVQARHLLIMLYAQMDRRKYRYNIYISESVQVENLKIIQHNYWSRRHENVTSMGATFNINISGKWLHNIMNLIAG